MSKFFFKVFVLAFLSGAFGSFATFFFMATIPNANISSSYLDEREEIIETPIVTIGQNFGLWEKVVADLSPRLVGIQAFKDDKIIRQGSGAIISSDGLIVTTADISGPRGSIYQVFYDDKVLRGINIAIDSKSNLMLLKTSALNSSIVELDTATEYKSGQDIALVGKLFNLSKPVSTFQKGSINFTTDRTIVLDTTANSYLYGFSVVNIEGRLRGLAYIRDGRVNLIKAELIEIFFKEYIEKSNQ